MRPTASPLPLPLLFALCGCDGRSTQPPPPAAFTETARHGLIPEGQRPTADMTEAFGHLPEALRPTVTQTFANLVRAYAPGWSATSRMVLGAFTERTSHDLAVPVRAGTCYRVLAVYFAASTPEPLLMTLGAYDATGINLERDESYSNLKVLGLRQPLCPARAGLLRVQVAASRAVGYFALTVYSGTDNGLGTVDFPQVRPIPSMPFTGE